MKPEPLKGRKRLIKILENIKTKDGKTKKMWFVNSGYLNKDVKSAVEWLLREVEKEFSRYRESGSNLEKSVKAKIKQAFEDVE